MDMWQDVKRHFLRTLKLGSRNIKNQAACSFVTSVIILFIIWLFVQKCSCSVVRQAPKRFLVDNRMLNAATDGIGYRPDPSCQGVSCIFTYFYNISHHNHHRFLVGLSLSLSFSLSDSLNLLCFSVLLCSGFSKDLEDLDLSCTAPWRSIVEASVDQLRDILWRNQPLYGSMALWLYVWLRLCPSDFASKHFGCRKSCVFNVSSTCSENVFWHVSSFFVRPGCWWGQLDPCVGWVVFAQRVPRRRVGDFMNLHDFIHFPQHHWAALICKTM